MNHIKGLRYPRTAGEAFKDHTYAACVERPMPRSPLASGWFWAGGIVSLAVWTLIWHAIAWVLGGGQ